MVGTVNMGLKVLIFPDNGMKSVLEQNMGNSRYIWNNLLARYNYLYRLFKSHNCPLNPSINNLNAILKMLKKENTFLYDGESTSQQQVFLDLNLAFKKFSKKVVDIPSLNPKETTNNHLE